MQKSLKKSLDKLKIAYYNKHNNTASNGLNKKV